MRIGFYQGLQFLIGFIRSPSSKRSREGDSQECLPESFISIRASSSFPDQDLKDLNSCDGKQEKKDLITISAGTEMNLSGTYFDLSVKNIFFHAFPFLMKLHRNHEYLVLL